MNEWSGCAFNYTGSKARFLDEIYQILPNDDNLRVLDLFTGGGSLATQLPESWSITANDKESRLMELHSKFQQLVTGEPPVELVERLTTCAHLLISSSKDTEGYNKLVNDYNDYPQELDLYTLLCSSFSNQLRWNSDGKWNMQKKLKLYLERLAVRDLMFVSKDFREFNYSDYDLIISDSPYLKTNAAYNENGGWGLSDSVTLMSRLDKADSVNTKFIMFEELWSKGVPNKPLIAWAGKYNMKQLGSSSDSCNYQRVGGKTQEVMIYNF
jgi:site-specific DNA-adenine methylase